MNKKKWTLVIALVLAAAITVFFIVKKHSSDCDEIEDYYPYEETICEEDYTETGEDLFCNYLSPKDWPNDDFFHDMVEEYNAFALLNGLKTVFDEWMRFESSERALELIQHADVERLASPDLRELFSRYIMLGRQLYTQGMDNTDSLFKQFYFCQYQLDSTLTTRFYIDRYVNLTEEQYDAALDTRSQTQELLKGTRCETISSENINSSDAQKDIKMILKRIHKEKDFDKKCSYTMAYVYHVGFHHTDFSVLDKLLNDGRYSPQLFFLWRIWRCGVQLCTPNCGPSTWSIIPNKIYNDRRQKIAEATLRHIVDHRNDAVAINQFLITAAQTNILRDGQFPLGNESFTEVYYLGLAPTTDDSE
ncbi:MAG: hypothetical protein J6T88_07585 [Bacteroidales bacterium]|nr:hypothetical protein [Bacteroidales bacterium]